MVRVIRSDRGRTPPSTSVAVSRRSASGMPRFEVLGSTGYTASRSLMPGSFFCEAFRATYRFRSDCLLRRLLLLKPVVKTWEGLDVSIV